MYSTDVVRRVNLFGVKIDALTLMEAVDQLTFWIDAPDGKCRYVVTPNVDHTVQLDENDELRKAYNGAALVLADGHPVVWASRFLGKGLPERVAGSDLVPLLFYSARGERPISVFLLGAAPGVAEQAQAQIHNRWPGVRVVGTYSPPLGFENKQDENDDIIRRVTEAAPDVLVVGLGAPKQELWIHRHACRLNVPVALCVGATIDFLAGHRRRAPRWMCNYGLEWFHRLISEPRRMAVRYARDAWVFPKLVWREWRHGKVRAGDRA